MGPKGSDKKLGSDEVSKFNIHNKWIKQITNIHFYTNIQQQSTSPFPLNLNSLSIKISDNSGLLNYGPKSLKLTSAVSKQPIPREVTYDDSTWAPDIIYPEIKWSVNQHTHCNRGATIKSMNYNVIM